MMTENVILPCVMALLSVLISATTAVRHRAPWGLTALFWFSVTVYFGFRIVGGVFG